MTTATAGQINLITRSWVVQSYDWICSTLVSCDRVAEATLQGSMLSPSGSMARNHRQPEANLFEGQEWPEPQDCLRHRPSI